MLSQRLLQFSLLPHSAVAVTNADTTIVSPHLLLRRRRVQ